MYTDMYILIVPWSVALCFLVRRSNALKVGNTGDWCGSVGVLRG